MKNKTILILLAFTLFVVQKNQAQDEDLNDWESWNSIGIKYKLNKKWAFELEQHLRLKENFSEIKKYITQVGVQYNITKKFKVGAAARYISKNDNTGNIQGYEDYFRFHLEASYKHKVDDFTFGYRLRYQNKNELGVSPSEGDYANQHLRFKASVGYNIKNWKLDPEVSAEIFNHFEEGEENGFDRYRITVGSEYNMKAYGKLKFYYRFKKQLNETYPETKNIIGLKYTYTIKNK
ncbi:DUF2490 domain-containing protein [Lutibacter holmesii]|uniref:DUF2490 domain-containing protein n=1 Tax=Lutibacter holmesii TaxID=1137985 RepID=A0ABW3WMY3_9FLAO